MDLYITDKGDLRISPGGDLATVDTVWRSDIQACYVRIMTDPGDWLPYPELGAGLSRLYGMPQSPTTGQLGVQLITSALEREGRFKGKSYTITPVPIGYQEIRFDINIVSGAREQVNLSVIQDL